MNYHHSRVIKKANVYNFRALAEIVFDRGNPDTAEWFYRGAIERSQKVSGPRGELAEIAMNQLGDLYVSQGKLAEAQRVYKTGLEEPKQTLDEPRENLSLHNMLYSSNRITNTPLLAAARRKVKEMYGSGDQDDSDSERLSDLDIIPRVGLEHKTGRKLCLYCRELSFEGMTRSSQKQHHISYGSLNYSANAGCEFCKVLRRILVLSYSRKLSWDYEKVHEYHIQRDEENCEKDNPDQISRFYIEPLYGDIDCRFTKSRQALFGILFVRRTPDGDVLEEVFPFLKFEAQPGKKNPFVKIEV
jgi:Tetratricopeptide repeat